MTEENNGSIIYFSHGGGPLPILGDPGHAAMVDFLTRLPGSLPRPERILVVSAHWEEPAATVLGGDSPDLFYDYYGFPEESYSLDYPAPGSPELAGRVSELLGLHDIECRTDTERGFDHGMFIPLMIMYPEADIPVTQLSLVAGLNPERHLDVGRALRPLKDENTMIIGSGFSFHNMREFFRGGSGTDDPENDAFQNWLIDLCTSNSPEDERERQLTGWTEAPGARYCHPREEHLIPLHVCQGAAGGPAGLIFDDYIIGKRAAAFRW